MLLACQFYMVLPHRWVNIGPCLYMIRADLSFSFRLHFLCYTSCCMPVWDYYIWKYYTTCMYCVFICRIFIFTAPILPLWQFNMAFGSCGYFNPPLSDPRENQLIHLRVLTAFNFLFLGLPGFLNLGPKLDESTLNCGDYWMQAFRVKIYAVACACFSVHSGIQRNLVHCQQKSKLKSRNPLWNPEIQSKNDTGYHQKILYFKLITSLDLHGRARRHNSTYISAHKWSLYPTNFRYKGHFPRWRCNVMHAYLFMHYIYTPYVVSRPRPKIGRGLGWG